MKETGFFKKRLCAILTILVIMANILSPYGIFASEVFAAIGADEPYFILQVEQPGDPNDENSWSDNDWEWYYWEYNEGDVATPDECTSHFVTVNVLLAGGKNVNGAAMKFWFDSSVLQPKYKKKQRGKWAFFDATSFDELGAISADFTDNPGSPDYNADDSVMYFNCNSLNFVNATPESPYTVATFHFLLQDGFDPKELTTDLIELRQQYNSGGGVMVDGLEIGYFPNGAGTDGRYSVGKDYLKFDGFKEPEVERTVTNIELKGAMTNQYYVKGEDLDFSGLTLTITYDDGTSQEIENIADELKASAPLIQIDTKTAAVTRKSNN